jgi:Tfp pilus assembly protein PilF
MTAHAVRQLQAALELHNKGLIAEAESVYLQILADDSKHPGALHLLGVIRQQQGRHEEALELIGRAIAVNPAKAVYHNNYGAALLSLQRFAEAQASFERAVVICPLYADAIANLGMAQFKLADETAAEVSFRKALGIDPYHRDALKRLAALLAEGGRMEEAERLLRQAIANRATGETLLDLGNLLMSAGRPSEAADAYRQAIAKKGDYALAHFNLASAYEEMQLTEQAKTHFSRAADLLPEKPLWRLRAELCGPVFVCQSARDRRVLRGSAAGFGVRRLAFALQDGRRVVGRGVADRSSGRVWRIAGAK